VTRSGSAAKIYKNGVEVTSVFGTHLDPSSNNYINKIATRVDNQNFFNGLIDEVRVYNTVLTIGQIQSQYHAGLDRLLAKGLIDKGEDIVSN
jgi:hypothetical protein